MPTSTRPSNFEKPPSPDALLNGSESTASDRTWHEWMMVGIGLTGLLAAIAIVAAMVALANNNKSTTTIVRQASPTANTSKVASHSATAVGSGLGQSGAGAVVPIVLQKDATTGVAGTITGRDGWPRYAPSAITVPAGKKVTLMITNYDDVATALPANELTYDKVHGGQETVNGKSATTVSNKLIAHTFTVQQLGVNIPIPMAPTGGAVTVTFTFTAHKAGTYLWQCFTPCGLGKTGMGGPMMTNGYMRGTVTVD